MNRRKFDRLCIDSFLRRLSLSRLKAQDYAGEEDILSNFKRVAKICETLGIDVSKPEGVAAFFIIHKLDRLWRLIRLGLPPANESLRDTLDDLRNYADLLEAILTEEEE